MNTVDCIQEYTFTETGVVTMYRPRVYSSYVGRMVEISSNKALQPTAKKAIEYGLKWL